MSYGSSMSHYSHLSDQVWGSYVKPLFDACLYVWLGSNGQDNVGVPSGVGGGGATHDRESTFQAGLHITVVPWLPQTSQFTPGECRPKAPSREGAKLNLLDPIKLH